MKTKKKEKLKLPIPLINYLNGLQYTKKEKLNVDCIVKRVNDYAEKNNIVYTEEQSSELAKLYVYYKRMWNKKRC